MLMISFLFTAALFSLFVVLKIFEAQFKMKKRIGDYVNSEVADVNKELKVNLKGQKNLIIHKVQKLKGHIDDYYSKRMSSSEEESIEKKLLQAGSPFGMNSIDFQILNVSLKIGLPLLFGFYASIIKSGIKGILIGALLGFLAGFFLPNFYLNLKISQRCRKALRELPDFLDLLTVSLEAGLGFDLALNKVISKRNGVLSSEFHTCLEEMRLGKTRKEALTGVKERLGFDELKSLINSILQAEKLGISMVQILRIKSLEERDKRKQRAEEEALKAPIKILFPLVLFIFPSIFIVLMGPVVIQFMKGIGN